MALKRMVLEVGVGNDLHGGENASLWPGHGKCRERRAERAGRYG